MTLTWDILESGDLALWYWAQDPNTDDPLATTQPEGNGWNWTADGEMRNFPPAVLDLCYRVAVDYVAANGLDQNYVRFALEVSCEQIEQRQ